MIADSDLFGELTDAMYDVNLELERVQFCDGVCLGMRLAAESFYRGGL